MQTQTALHFTRTRIVFGDMILNWFLGAVITFLPSGFEEVIARGRLLPMSVYRGIGIILLFFAAWQTWVVIKGKMTPGDLVFAGVMAIVPVALLTAGLLIIGKTLYPGWRIALWVGDVYMLFLGAWYVYLARLTGTGGDATPSTS